MRVVVSLLSAVALLIGPAPASTAACPSFKDYPASPSLPRAVVEPIVPQELSEAKGYRQVLDDAKNPANFAGHYRVSEDTCGTSLVTVMIADLRTGLVRKAVCL